MSFSGAPMVEEFFSEHSQEWITGAYESDGYGYPTALARVSRTLRILTGRFPSGGADVLDLGCGGGQLCRELADLRFKVTGLDQSESMLAEAQKELSLLDETARSRVKFLRANLLDNGLEASAYDAISAMGVIGYLPDDDALFSEAARLLRPQGVLVLSCRNRLFNMVSLSDYTLREIEQGGAKELVEEIRELVQQIPEGDAASFAGSLAAVSRQAAEQSWPDRAGASNGPVTETTEFGVSGVSIEARQHSPKRLVETAARHGFQHQGFYGINPHLLMAGLNRNLPPGLFNLLSSSLETLAHLPASLIWGSVFIGEFRKTA